MSKAKYVSTTIAGNMLGKTRVTVIRMIYTGKLKAIKFKTAEREQWLIDEKEIERLKNTTTPKP